MPAADYELVIGDKRWSSWSLRPWLLMTVFGIPFRETPIRLRQQGTAEQLARHSPSGLVPVLKASGIAVWDSLAIVEFVAEEHRDKPIWPADRALRAAARTVSAEMHSGFYSLRKAMPMDFLNVHAAQPVEDDVRRDIERIVALWTACRQRSGQDGDFLFGAFTAADAMFAPVATRFRSYSVDLRDFGDDGAAAHYATTVLSLPEMTAWGEGAAREG